IQNAVLAPKLQLTIDAFAGGADEDTELLLRDVDFRAEIGGQRAEPAREPHRQRLQDGFLHSLAHPANALAQQLDQFDSDTGFALEMAEKILPTQHKQFSGLAGGGVGGTALAVEHRDLAEEIAGPEKIQGQAAAVARPGFDPD